MAFALQNFNEYLRTGQRAVAEALGRDVVTFAYGERPFEPYEEKEQREIILC